MKTQLAEIASDTWRISTFYPDYGIQVNQFLVRDELPFLMHTGFRAGFADALAATASLIDPQALRWIGVSHFEADECGALNDWLEVAPNAQPACSQVGAMVNLADFSSRPAKPMLDNEALDLGRHRLRFLATPHVPHGWDAGFFFDETERTLFCSDLFFQPGDPGPLTESDIVKLATGALLAGMQGPLAHDVPYRPYTDVALRRLADLEPGTLATMHGHAFRGDGGNALRELAEVFRRHLGGDGSMPE